MPIKTTTLSIFCYIYIYIVIVWYKVNENLPNTTRFSQENADINFVKTHWIGAKRQILKVLWFEKY